MDLAEFKQRYPAYADVPDQKLAAALYNKFYAPRGMSEQDFYSKISFAPAETTTSPAEEEKPLGGFWDTFLSQAQTFGLGPEAAAFAANPTDENRKKFLADAETKYREVGFGEGENLAAFLQLLGGSLGAQVAPAAAGLVGTAFGGVGGPAAYGATSAAQYNITNLLRQAQEQERAIQEGRTPEEVSEAKALAGAVGQAGLDIVSFGVFGKIASRFPFARALSGMAGETATKEAADVLADAASKGTLQFAGGVAKGVGKGVAFEVPQEMAQQGIERWQAGLPLADDEAQAEYLQAAIGAAVLGGGFGAIEGALPARRPEAPAKEEDKEITSEEQDEYIRLYGERVAQLRQKDPTLTQRAAVVRLRDEAEDLLAAARANVAAKTQQEETGEAEDGTARPDIGGGEPSVPSPDGAGAIRGAPEETKAAAPPGVEAAGRSAEPDIGRTGAGEPSLTEDMVTYNLFKDKGHEAPVELVDRIASRIIDSNETTMEVRGQLPNWPPRVVEFIANEQAAFKRIAAQRSKTKPAPGEEPDAEDYGDLKTRIKDAFERGAITSEVRDDLFDLIDENLFSPQVIVNAVERALKKAAPSPAAEDYGDLKTRIKDEFERGAITSEVRDSLFDLIDENLFSPQVIVDAVEQALKKAAPSPDAERLRTPVPDEFAPFDLDTYEPDLTPVRQGAEPAPPAAPAFETDLQEYGSLVSRGKPVSSALVGRIADYIAGLEGRSPEVTGDLQTSLQQFYANLEKGSPESNALNEAIRRRQGAEQAPPAKYGRPPNTVAQVNAALAAEGIPQTLQKGNGYFYFTPNSNDAPEIPSVSTNSIRTLNLGWWVDYARSQHAAAMEKRLTPEERAALQAKFRPVVASETAPKAAPTPEEMAFLEGAAPLPGGEPAPAVQPAPTPAPEVSPAPEAIVEEEPEPEGPLTYATIGTRIENAFKRGAITPGVRDTFARRFDRIEADILEGREPKFSPQDIADALEQHLEGFAPTLQNLAPNAFRGYEGGERPRKQQVRANQRFTKLNKLFADGMLTPTDYVEQASKIAADMAQAAKDKAFKEEMTPRKRGADIVRQRLLEFSRRGELDPGDVEFALWVIGKNPAMAEGVAISVKQAPEGKEGVAGDYNAVEALVRIFKGHRAAGTEVHEILHHTERMMPERIQRGIADAWGRAYVKALSKSTDKQREALELILPAVAGGRAARASLFEAFADGVLDRDVHYQLVNPSEFWAVNATRILNNRYDAATSKKPWVRAARQWLSEFVERAKGWFGLRSDSAILAGLREVLATEGARASEYRSITDVLGGRPATQLENIAPTPPSDEQVAAATKLTPAQIKYARMAAGVERADADAFQKKLMRSRNAAQANATISETVAGTRGGGGFGLQLRAMWESMGVGTLRKLLPALTTEDITRWKGDTIPAIRRINKRIEQLTVSRMQDLNLLAEEATKWIDFNKRSPKGEELMGDVMLAARYYNVDPTLAPSALEYYKIDGKLKELTSSNAPVSEINRRKGEIARVYGGGKVEFTDASGVKMTRIVGGWNDFNKPGYGGADGKAIFKMARDAYKRNFDRYYNLLMSQLNDARLSDEDTKAAKDQIEKMFEDARKSVVYFPLMRYGKYWLSVGKGKNAAFYTFETATARNLARLRLEREGETREMNQGDNIQELRDRYVGKSATSALSKIMELLNTGDAADVDILKDHVFQLYLASLPEGDMRTRFLHAQFKEGFSTDMLRNFMVSQHTAANQLARLKHSYKLRNTISEAYASLKGHPDRARLVEFVREMEFRAQAEVTPPVNDGGVVDWDKLATLGNKIVFLWMLTSPKSALIQATQLHTVGIPVLSAKFGAGRTLAVAARYAAGVLAGQKLGLTKKDRDGNVMTRFGEPSVKDSKYLRDMEKTDPVMHEALLYAWNYANERDMFMGTFVGDLNGITSVPSGEYGALNALKRGRVVSAGMQGIKAAFNMMGAGFHHMERMNREIMYMSAFELAFRKQLREKKTPEQAMGIAAKEAQQLTYDSLFNFTNYNKPRLVRHPVGRISFQFMMFPLQMSSYLVRNFYGMLPGLNAEGKVAAAKQFFGTMAMTGIYAGLTGLPLYGALMSLLEGMRDVFRDDEDDPELLKYMDDDGNPLGKVSLDFWFKTKFIPEFFGPGSSLAKTFGLTDEQAAILARAAELGPVSAFTDLNVQSSTSLDGLWHTQDLKSDTTEGKFKEMLFNGVFGPLGSLIANTGKAVDMYERGEGNRALELIMPAFYRGTVRASRLQDEGLLMQDGTEIKPKEFYSIGKLFAQQLGFGSTETYQIQSLNIAQRKIEKDITDRRSKLLERYNVALEQYLRSSDPSAYDKVNLVWDDIFKFNANFPTVAIGLDSLNRSQERRREKAAKAVEGSVYNPDVPVGLNLLEMRLLLEDEDEDNFEGALAAE